MWPPSRLLVYYALLTIPCVSAQSNSLSTVLPSSLIDVIPSCSVSCLEYFVIFNYPPSACPRTQDIDCLCSTNTTTGFTLGEAALRCVVSSCPGAVEGNTQTYSVCSGVKNALPETHSTITATLMAATTIPVSRASMTATSLLPSNIPNPSTTFSGTSLVSDTGMPTFAPSVTHLSSSTLTPIAATADPQVKSTTMPTPHSNTSLGTDQIIGIAMGGVASAIIVFGALLFVYCLRRKRRLKRQSDLLPFQIEKAPPKTPPNTPQPASPPRPQPLGLNISGGNLAISNPNKVFQALQPDKRRSFWRKSIKAEEIGVAMSPENKQDSPASFNSTRTASRLLPEKPNYSLFPAPLRISRQPARPTSIATEFEDDFEAGRRSYVPPSITIQERDSSYAPQYPAPVYQPDPQAMMKANEYNAAAASYVDQVMTGRERYQSQFQQAPRGPTQHPRSQLPRLDAPLNVSQRAPSSTYSGNYSLPPTEPRDTIVFPVQEPTRQTDPQRLPSARDSHASDTSFEFEEDETPPEERNQRQRTLATVIESPIKSRSPISDLRYPKLPRPASMKKSATYAPLPLKLGSSSSSQREPPNPAKTRQPRALTRPEPHLDPPFLFSSSSSSREDSPSSLLAKRRGDQAAEIIEKGLRLRPNTNTPASRKWKVVKKESVKTPGSAARISPRRRGAPVLSRENSDDVYGTPRGRDDRAAKIYEEALKSPMWEPKLTPTRRGNDLFLSVERD